MEYHLQNIVGDAKIDAFWLEKEGIPPGEMFRFEHHLEGIKDKQMVAEVSEALTLFAHIVARERLALLKAELREAENNREDYRIIEILGQAKDAEKLLQAKIEIEKPVIE